MGAKVLVWREQVVNTPLEHLGQNRYCYGSVLRNALAQRDWIAVGTKDNFPL